jgi:hypothetical protein
VITPDRLSIELWCLSAVGLSRVFNLVFYKTLFNNKYYILWHYLLCIYFLYDLYKNLISKHIYYKHSIYLKTGCEMWRSGHICLHRPDATFGRVSHTPRSPCKTVVGRCRTMKALPLGLWESPPREGLSSRSPGRAHSKVSMAEHLAGWATAVSSRRRRRPAMAYTCSRRTMGALWAQLSLPKPSCSHSFFENSAMSLVLTIW